MINKHTITKNNGEIVENLLKNGKKDILINHIQTNFTKAILGRTSNNINNFVKTFIEVNIKNRFMPQNHTQETFSSNIIRIETEDESDDFIEIILPEESMLDNAVNIADKLGNIPLPAFKFAKLPKHTKNIYRFTKGKNRSLTRDEVLEIVERLPKNVSDSRRRIVKSKKELDELWQRLTKNAKELEPKADKKFGQSIYRRELNDETIIQYKKASKSGGETIEINSQNPRQNLRSIHIKP